MTGISKLGRYELRRVLGKGAMGVVYEAFDPALNRAVAVKTVLKSIVADEESSAAYSARFAREAKAVARLNHPHIVQVYDFGEQGDVAFLVMEFLRGRELRAYFDEQTKFDTAEAVRIALELLDALDFAHENGVIHRDVKPANVMLDEQRRVKLADFGVARIQDGSERSKAGTMVGTPAFMSPEQVSGARVDRRTDLFSTGIVLYQLLTGEQAFKGDGAWTVAKAIMQDEPPRPSTVAGKVSPAFDAILSKALAKRADQRFASAKDFALALRAAQAGTAPAPETQVAGEAEVEFWRSIHASADPAEFRLYLKNFPQGVYAELAQLKLAKLTSGVAEAEPSGDAEELSALAQRAAQQEAQFARKEAELREREAKAQAAREAEALKNAEAESRREADLKAQAAAQAKAHVDALEKIRREAQAGFEKREAELRQREAEVLAPHIDVLEKVRSEAQAELERKEAELRQREAQAVAQANAEARARAAAEARVRQEAEMLAAKARAEVEARAREETAAFAKATEEAEARAKLETAERLRREADMKKRAAEAAARETALRKQLAEAPRAKLSLIPVLIAVAAVMAVAAGGWYQYTSSQAARVAELTVLLETATRATQQLDDARRQREASLRELDLARTREEEARKSGDLAKLKDAQDASRRAETEAAKQTELVARREAEAKKAEDAAKLADVKKQTDIAKAAADKIATEKAAAEKAAAEKAAAQKPAEAKKSERTQVAVVNPSAVHVVQRGDTWFRIGSTYKHEGVTRNQMLLAIYRANLDAFPGGNPNLLEVGATISIPAREVVAAVGAPEADRLVRSLILLMYPSGPGAEKAAADVAEAEKAEAEKAAANSVEAQLESFIQRKGRDKVLKQEPPGNTPSSSLGYGVVVYVDDGSCPPGRIKEITGTRVGEQGSTVRPPTPRPTRCISLSD